MVDKNHSTAAGVLTKVDAAVLSPDTQHVRF
jgi:hypothetical protein